MSEPVKVEPEPNRQIVVADDAGVLWKLPIVDFVLFVTMREFIRRGVEFNHEMLSNTTPDVARQLVSQGWFTYNEYREAWVESEVERLDEELKQL